MLSTDRKIFENGSAVRERIVEYGTLFDELHVIVASTRGLKLRYEHIAPNIWLYPTNSFIKYFQPFSFFFIGKNIIKEKHFENTHTVITAQDPFETGLVGAFLAKKFKLKLQIQVHTDFLNPIFFESSILNRIRLHISAYVLPRADGIRVVSEKIKKMIVSKMNLPSIKIKILPIFVDAKALINLKPTVDIKQKYPQFKFVILMPTRFSAEKNLLFALDVFRTVLNKYPFTGLVLVGEGVMEKNLRLKVKDLNMENSIIFESWSKDVVSYLKTASLLLVTSKFEGYGMSIIEAGLSGCPVVSSKVGVAEELVSGISAEICPVDDLSCFVNSIITLIENNELRENQRMHLKQHFENTIDTKKKYLANFKSALNLWAVRDVM